MHQKNYRIVLAAGDDRSSSIAAKSLSDALRGVSGVLDSQRKKLNESTMDVGTIVSIVATSSATLAIAQGIADWIRRNRGVTLTMEKSLASGSIKVAVANIDAKAAEQIIEKVGSL